MEAALSRAVPNTDGRVMMEFAMDTSEQHSASSAFPTVSVGSRSLHHSDHSSFAAGLPSAFADHCVAILFQVILNTLKQLLFVHGTGEQRTRRQLFLQLGDSPLSAFRACFLHSQLLNK